VKTIDSWQGREKEFMIFSAVRCNNEGKIGFLENRRRINVALTRAQHGLIIVGNKETLSVDTKWKNLIKILEEEKCIVNGVEDAKKKIISLINSIHD
jgi:superfamily I DNA and/or RNA helicase